ncbi:30S ribosomal protein S6 [Candidatus Saccharibacteria bacterium]|nr:30S ribosomal protein S6 [Candidatus Saccharibacteria bacterium]
MKQYELTVVVHPDLEMNVQPALDKVDDLIKSVGGKIIKDANDGKKHMTYKIKDQEFGLYYSYDLELPTDAPNKIERGLTIMDEVIRHLLVTKDERKEKMEARRKALEEAEGDKATEEEPNSEEEE